MKKIFILALSAIFSLGVLSSCGGGEEISTNSSTTPSTSEVVKKYNINFYDGTNILFTKNVQENNNLPKPEDPIKEGFVFDGWYLDSSFKNSVTFPFKVTQESSIYAKFIDAKEQFLKVRDNTVGEKSKGFEYDYTVNLQAKINGIEQGLNGNQIGSCQYNNSNDDTKINFYDNHQNTGSLFYDGYLYQTKTSTKLQKIRLNEDKEVTSIKDEVVDKDYKYGSSTFAKPLFEYNKDQIKSLNKQADGRYIIKTSVNASKILDVILENIDNPIIGKLIGVNIPDTASTFETFVTFDDKYLNSYEYLFNLDISKIKLSLSYKLDFTKKNESVNVTPKQFDNIHLKGSNEFKKDLNNINSYINNYYNSDLTSYDVLLKTGIDYGFTTNEINSTFNIKTKQQKGKDRFDFANKIEVDSDYKNADLYKENKVEDLTYYRGSLEDKTIWDTKWKLVGTEKDQKVVNPSNYDKHLLLLNSNDLPSLFDNSNYSCVSLENKEKENIYSLGLEENSIKLIMKYINDVALLTPYSTNNVKLLGTYDDSSIKIQNISFVIKTDKENLLKSIDIKIDGIFKTKFEGSRDFNELSESDFDIKLSLNVNKIDKFNIAKKPGDLKGNF